MKLALGLILGCANANQNPECSDLSESKKCTGDCEDSYVQCIIDCKAGTDCQSRCARDYTNCNEHCPCYNFCYEGCPCSYPNEYCVDDDVYLLIFNPLLEYVHGNDTQSIADPNAPADIDWEELNHRHVKFSWYLNTLPHVEEYHDVELSPFHPFPAFACSFKLYGKMYIIGGISEEKGGLPNGEFGNYLVGERDVTRLEDLPFGFTNGQCATYANSRTLACYHDEYDGGEYHPEEYCYEFNGDEWSRTGDTSYNHAFGSLAEFGKGAVIIGGTASTMTELYDPVKQTFEPKTNWAHLVGPGFGSFSAIGFNDKVYVFGGQNSKNNYIHEEVYVMNKNFEWSDTEQRLRHARYAFRTVKQGDKLIHVGGLSYGGIGGGGINHGGMPMELWQMKDGNDYFDIQESEIKLIDWAPYAESFVVGALDYLPIN